MVGNLHRMEGKKMTLNYRSSPSQIGETNATISYKAGLVDSPWNETQPSKGRSPAPPLVATSEAPCAEGGGHFRTSRVAQQARFVGVREKVGSVRQGLRLHGDVSRICGRSGSC